MKTLFTNTLTAIVLLVHCLPLLASVYEEDIASDHNNNVLVAAGLKSQSAKVQKTFYIAPDGNDNNPGTKEKPFATIVKARQTVRTVNKEMTGDIVVVLRGGIYHISKSILLEAEDSGINGHNIIYRAQQGESPLISGGKQVVGWKKDDKGRWKAPSPVDNFRQLYVGGVRAVRARGEVPANLEQLGDDGYKTTAVDMAGWKNPGDIEFCYLVVWAHTRCKVQSIKRVGDHAVITMLQPHFSNAKAKEGVNIITDSKNHPDLIYIENALELLDEPGEWYLDRNEKMIYYLPRQGEDMPKTETIVPELERLVELRGTPDQPVHNIVFEGVTFAHGNWLLPSKIGFVDVQANFVLDWEKNPLNRPTGLTNLNNQHLKSPANIVCHATRSVRFERCTFTKLGGAGLDIESGSQDNIVEGCRFYDISGTAVQVGDVLNDDHHPDDPRKIVRNNAIVNNYIHDCGLDHWGSIGVMAGYTEGTVIAHNEIASLPYSGISIGWGWGEQDAGGGNPGWYEPFKYDTPTAARNNRIEYNHIHGAMSKTDDGGGIYTLGNQPGTIIRSNYIHDCKNTKSKRNWICGIYLDEGSGFIEVTGNLVHDVPITDNYNNKVQNRLATCKVHDNFFGISPEKAKGVVQGAGLEADYRDLLK